MTKIQKENFKILLETNMNRMKRLQEIDPAGQEASKIIEQTYNSLYWLTQLFVEIEGGQYLGAQTKK
jgi:hypothetical protein